MITGITAREQLSTPFVRLLNFCYKHISRCIAYHPWLVIIFTLIFAITASSKLPFIRIENDIQDFTPYSARARTEYQLYQSYFTGKGEPTIIFVFITPKSGDSVMTLGALRESVVVLDTILDDIALTDSSNNRSYPFSKFCDEFCNSNEPIRQVYVGLNLCH
ncbi:hypothetical protein AB6A40_007737 [Gnathostoma spinigerum]|uniref:Uncharacterized protein n=1 Tax=Gnathostoma spinigerum TaxID=75299 RepID=A0ABD6EVE5_9BILA